MPFVDLHIHSNYSDGTETPREIARRAAALGLAAIAITDHDTVAGLDEGAEAAREVNIEFLPGTEISASYGLIEVHVIGLGINAKNASLVEALERLRECRASRVDAMIRRLNEKGIAIERGEVEMLADKNGALGRMHVARALKARGITRTVQEAFDRFLKSGKRAYVPKKNVSCAKAMDLIHGAGGVAILAHPGVGATVHKILPRLLLLPFDGIEVFHSKHTAGHIDQFMQLARANGLLISGGSDCHGNATRQPAMGTVRVPYEYFDAIKKRLDNETHSEWGR